MRNSILKLSNEQEKAVDITKNIAVSAGAGSGKTRVLTNRYLRLLESGIEIEEIVALTFTEKAALEMKERIRGAVSEKIEKSSLEEKIKWNKTLDRLSRANISTIHSFCAKVIRENAASFGFDFKFNIINEIDRNIELNKAIEKSLKSILDSGEYKNIIEKLDDTYGEEYLANSFKNELIEILEKIFQMGLSLNEVYEELKNNEISNFALKILLNTEKLYREYKLNNDRLDYSDLEMLCNKVLKDKKVRDRYKERYKRFLVDEFQDTNEIQKSIIYNFVTDENGKLLPKRLFVVGDSKQSIYGFRGTDNTIYRKVANDIGEDGQISLSTCYRSKPEIIYGINEIFSRLIEQYESLKIPDENFDKNINEKRLILLTYKKEGSRQENTVQNVKDAIKNKTINTKDFKNLLNELKNSYNRVQVNNSIKQEAISKAVKILFDKGLKAKDICILVRSKYIIPDIENELKKYNIPYCVIGGRGFYEKEEIKEILNIYELITNNFIEKTSVDIEMKLIKSLRSFVFNISDDVLYKIKLEQMENEELNYFKAMELAYDGMKDSIERSKLENAYLKLLKLSKMKDRLCAVQMLAAIIEVCSIKEAVLMQEDGLQKYRNVEKLIFEAERFDKEKLFTPEELIKHIELLNDNNLEDAEASLDSEDTEAVKIMTIHQSKGLEFEGVIIPEMDSDQLKISKKEKNQNNLVYHNRNIISKYDFEDKNNKKEVTEEYNAYLESKFINEVKESIRLLYVALTRAKQYVVMVGAEMTEDISEISEESEKLNKLNSFMKQVMYSCEIKGADKAVIEFLDAASITCMNRLENASEESEKIEIPTIKENLEFKISNKIRNYVSASKYMKYKKCPRRFYIEYVLNFKPINYVSIEEKIIDKHRHNFDDMEYTAIEVFNKDEQSQEQVTYLESSDMGIIVHKILEYKNSLFEISDENLIEKAMIEILGKDTVNSLKDVTGVKNKIKSFINNYNFIEKNRKNFGENILNKNEVSFLLSPLPDGNTMLTGFIDKLEVFKSEEKYIAVITDYKTNHIENDEDLSNLVEIYSSQLRLYGKAIKDSLYIDERKIDEVHLQLYFLEKGICKEIVYDDQKTDELINDMDGIFSRYLEEMEVENFIKAQKEECEKCIFCNMCLV